MSSKLWYIHIVIAINVERNDIQNSFFNIAANLPYLKQRKHLLLNGTVFIYLLNRIAFVTSVETIIIVNEFFSYDVDEFNHASSLFSTFTS